jgi:hypothetical protein
LSFAAPGVDARTCVTRWRGEDCDYGMAVEGLLHKDGLDKKLVEAAGIEKYL